MVRRSPRQGFTLEKDQLRLAGLCQVAVRTQDFVLVTASWAKISRPWRVFAKRRQDGPGNIRAAICDALP